MSDLTSLQGKLLAIGNGSLHHERLPARAIDLLNVLREPRLTILADGPLASKVFSYLNCTLICEDDPPPILLVIVLDPLLPQLLMALIQEGFTTLVSLVETHPLCSLT